MATNTKYKRDAVAIMRDGIKSNYNKASDCKICGVSVDLELHHYHTVALLVKNYAKENRLDFNDQNVVLENREAFYKKYWHELVEHTVTLCADHHKLLHKVYSKEPPLFTASKQEHWVQVQREKTKGNKESLASSITDSNLISSHKDLTQLSNYKVQVVNLREFKV